MRCLKMVRKTERREIALTLLSSCGEPYVYKER
jgi:hypothetical protein